MKLRPAEEEEEEEEGLNEVKRG
ncbi:hypothetical protein E2C01_095397 [Portunus trituberculatus]|uniref:Uncharacterized protein n=1 Tax=Portunus trituberculatus TaxID=210409 RepID=A0A5B7JSX4_PORTR|nr:hypothetical protein [Portunus trituberculatus]